MRRLVHPRYSLKYVLYAAAEQFEREKSIQLPQFLLPKVFAQASRAALKAPLCESAVPDRHRVHLPKRIPANAAELLVWLKSTEAAAIVSIIARKKVRCRVAGMSIFTHGDYVLLHDKWKEKPGYDVILELTPQWDARACGHHSYVKDGEEVVCVVPVPNSFTIVQKPEGARKFIKYVNHRAGKDRRIVLLAFFA